MFIYCFFISFVYSILSSLLLLLWLLLLSSLFTVVERKVLASTHRRKGPSYLGYFGLIQLVADGVKLLFKDWFLLSLMRSSMSNNFLHSLSVLFAPLWMFVFSYSTYSILMVDFLFGTDFICMFLLIFVFGGLSHLGIILPGVLTDSKWTLLGSIRACILYISYDIVILICWLLLLPDGLSVNLFTSGTLSVIVDSQHSLITLNIFRYPFLFILLFLTILIEIGRIPSDLAEAESELVSGYNVEYGGFLYAMMASSEYAAMVLGGLLLILLFLGINSYYLLSLCLVLIFSLFILIRGTLPRVRYTDLLKLYWCDLMPLLLVVLSVYIII